MAKAKEFTVKIEDKPGALGKCFLALAEGGVNVLALPIVCGGGREPGAIHGGRFGLAAPGPCWADCA